MYNEVYQRLAANANEADWRASTNVNDHHTGERIGAQAALAAFQGSPYVIQTARALLESRVNLTELEFRQLDKILLNAAESPGTIPAAVKKRVEVEARLRAALDGFTFCLDGPVTPCPHPVSPNQIAEQLITSTDLAQRRSIWEVSKQSGAALKPGLIEARELRNRVARELGYSSYFHLQVADYGMKVDEMMALMEDTLEQVAPLYQQLHLYARRKLSARYRQKEPRAIPAHWMTNRWAQEWPGLLESLDLDSLFRGRSPEWIVQQAERFYISLGFAALPRTFWQRSDLYEVPAGSSRKKNSHASAWHIDLDTDVRCLMNVVPNNFWFGRAHHEIGHAYYYLAYSKPAVPVVLRAGANRAFHEGVGELIALAAHQEPYLRSLGLLPAGQQSDPNQLLLAEAMDSLVFLPFAAGAMTHFEHDLYEQRLPAEDWNRRWWDYALRYQGIVPPAPRPASGCDACTKSHIIDHPAQYYDFAIATLLKYQLHDHIARRILKQDPHRCNYAGNRQVGEWLQELLSLGQTRDWRQVLKEKTGEEFSARAMRDYFRPLEDYLKTANGGATPGWQ